MTEHTITKLFKLALLAFKEGKYESAYKICIELLKRRSQNLQYMNMLGEMYEKGLGVKSNPVMAYTFYTLTAKRSIKGKEGMKRIKTELNEKKIAEAQKNAQEIAQRFSRKKATKKK